MLELNLLKNSQCLHDHIWNKSSNRSEFRLSVLLISIRQNIIIRTTKQINNHEIMNHQNYPIFRFWIRPGGQEQFHYFRMSRCCCYHKGRHLLLKQEKESNHNSERRKIIVKEWDKHLPLRYNPIPHDHKKDWNCANIITHNVIKGNHLDYIGYISELHSRIPSVCLIY